MNPDQNPAVNPSTTLTARTPEDLLAVVPVVLGFVPHHSVVMLTFGPSRPFHARVDLPHDPGDTGTVVEVLLDPATRHGVERVAFVVYTPDGAGQGTPTAALVPAVTGAFADAGIEVVEMLRADGRRWFPLLPGRSARTYDGVPYDVSAHPFAAQAILDGQVTHASREALASSLVGTAPLPMDLVERAALRVRDSRGERQRPAEAVWVETVVQRHLELRTPLSDDDAARLLVAVVDLGLRDIPWTLMSRRDARRHVVLWTDLVRRAPEPLLPAPAALLSFAAWLAGHGALAWCAVDRCLAIDPEYTLAGYISTALTNAVPPSVWEPPNLADLPAFDPA